MRRREEILAAAAELFRERGYAGVGMDELGAAVGMTGPALYSYFSGKDRLLLALFERAHDQVSEAFADAAAHDAAPRDRLARAVGNYVALALRDRHVAAIYAREIHNLPREHRARLRDAKRRTSRGVEALLRDVRPGMSPAEARTRLAAALEGLVGSVAHLSSRLPADELRDVLTRMALAALLAE